MTLYTTEELAKLRVYKSLKEALKRPADVVCLELSEDSSKPSVLRRIGELRNLQSLSIVMMEIRSLLEGFGTLNQLQELRFQGCEIGGFPPEILSLKNLRSLAVGNSDLTDLPAGIAELRNMEKLRLNHNKLESLPESIGQLRKLKILAVSFNRIHQLPESLGELQLLECLFAGANSLKGLPEGLWSLVNLSTLDVSGNGLTALSEKIGNLQKLKSLDLERNPFISLPSCLAEVHFAEHVKVEPEKRKLFMDWTYPHSEKKPRCEIADLRLSAETSQPLVSKLKVRIRDAGLEEFEESVVSRARDAITIETTMPEDYSSSGGSRFGGFPDLPSREHFPTTDGGYWIFLAQLNLAEIAHMNDYLPRSGILSFFVDSTESLNARVLFHEGNCEHLSTVRHSGAEEMFAPDDDYTKTPHRLKFTRVVALPLAPPWLCEWGSPAEKAYDGLTQSVDHQINGYTYTQHESPQEQAAAKMRGAPEEWVPLLKLGWDEKVGFCFWDAGTLTFCIHQEDLRRNDFSRVQVSLESS